jgi:Methyltransferase domain
MKAKLKRLLPFSLLRRYEHELRKETHINRALRLFGSDAAYLEIGVRDGACIRQISAGRKYAVDPEPVDPAFIGQDGTHMAQMTSDSFFSEAAPALLGAAPVHVALVDGLHEFRQSLRDILNIERHIVPQGIVFVHDCNPPTRQNAEERNGPWNGDVWKVALYLARFRPDLAFFTLNCDWGVGVVSGFSRTPPAVREEGVEEIAALDYDVLDRDRVSILRLRSPLAMAGFLARRHFLS